MDNFFHIKARLPRPAGLELCARLLAERPWWDIEPAEDGLSFVISLQPGRVDEELSLVEEVCRNVERLRGGLEIGLEVSRLGGTPPPGPDEADAPASREEEDPKPGLSPTALGPWRLIRNGYGEQDNDGQRIILPEGLNCSRRLWAEEALLCSALIDHLSPPPGAPETKGLPVLIMESGPPLALVAAKLAGAGPLSLIIDEPSLPLGTELFRLNGLAPEEAEGLAAPVPRAEPAPTASQADERAADGGERPSAPQAEPAAGDQARPPFTLNIYPSFKSLSGRRKDWAGRFGLIVAHLSPYLSSRRLKSLARWLRPEGVIIVGGFAPGPQTAQILRGAARAGLELSQSINDGDWAAMKLVPAPWREELPPLTGSVVPALMDLPPEAREETAEEGRTEVEPPEEENREEIPEEDSLMVEEPEEDD